MFYCSVQRVGTTLYNKIIFFCLALATLSFSGNGENTNAFNKYMSPEGGVNPMSGTVALSKSLASISAGEVSVSFDLSYSGNIFKEVKTKNDQTTVGIVGLGWTFGRARIVSDTRGTSYLGDDQYYLMLSSGGRFKIFQDASKGDKWWVEGNPYLKVERVVESTDMTGRGDRISYVKGWKIIDTKGITHYYGDLDETANPFFTEPERNATEYDLFWPLRTKDTLGLGLVGKAVDGTPYLYPTVWNVSKEIDIKQHALFYTYEQFNEKLSGDFEKLGTWNSGDSAKYTKESYLTMVHSSEGDTLKFEYGNKGEGEFFGEFMDTEGKFEAIGDTTADMFIEKVNRKYLSRIEIFGRKGRLGAVELCYTALSPLFVEERLLSQNSYFVDLLKETIKEYNKSHVKRLLSEIHYFNRSGEETDYEYYDYYDGTEKEVPNEVHPVGALYRIKGKECGWVEYTYAESNLGNGYSEILNAKKIFGKGFLEDGTPYIVGNRGAGTVVLFHRINGNWKEVATIKTNDVDEDGDIVLGDAGWFLIKDNYEDTLKNAMVYQWNGKDWENVYTDIVNNPEKEFFTNPFGDVKAMNIFAGPDYVVETHIEGNQFGSNASVKVIWSKWGDTLEVGKGFSDAVVDKNGIVVIPQKNHMLIQLYSTDDYNTVRVYVYTFDSKGGLQKTQSEEDLQDLDNGNTYMLGEDHFVEIAEPDDVWWDADSRFRAWVWTGSGWSEVYKDIFANDGLYTAMDLPAHGRNYYAVRHHANRYMTNFWWDGEKWDIPEGQNRVQFQDYAWFSDAWKWTGFSGSDFFVAGQARLDYGFWDGLHVIKNVYLHHYYYKDGNWKYRNIGKNGDDENEKDVITGRDWFVEKATRLVKIWYNGVWNTSTLRGAMKDAYSLGEDAFAVPSFNNTTEIYYKVDGSFDGTYKSYHVSRKKIFEPVVDKTIEYLYTFGLNDGVAYDEANNTPLYKNMTVTLPAGQGTVETELCNGEYGGEYNVGLGSACTETQRGRSNSGGPGKTALVSRKQTYYERYRNPSWPTGIYQDRIKKEVAFSGNVKTVTDYTYSEKNGQVVSIKKKIGSKSTEEVIKYVVDLLAPTSDLAKTLETENRIEAVAGGYSCIKDCSTGRIISANANGWEKKDEIYKSVSMWSLAPKDSVTQKNVDYMIQFIAMNGDAGVDRNWNRSSYNSAYVDGSLVETTEGPNHVKITSFKDVKTERVYGTAANCGAGEGLMLSGEYCGPINDVEWRGCIGSDTSEVTGYAINGNTGMQYGRFSKKVLKLLRSGSLSATIKTPVKKKYRISAWVQTSDFDSVTVTAKLGSQVFEKNVLTNGSWQMIVFETPKLQSTSPAKFVLETSAPSGIHLQDIRVLPNDATSSALFWNDYWDKVQTTVDNRGVGSYVAFDHLGRENESYAETDGGNVYLATRQTFVDGLCAISKDDQDKLQSIKVNGTAYENPASHRTFSLNELDFDVDLVPPNRETKMRYSLVKGTESEWNGRELRDWNSACCSGLKKIMVDFSESHVWTLFVDVAPYDDSKIHGDYAFQFNMKENDWVAYGQIGGFADGKNPLFMNPYDSQYVAYLDKGKNTVYRSIFSQGSWNVSANALINESAETYAIASKKEVTSSAYYVSFIPRVNNAGNDDIKMAYPKTFGKPIDETTFTYMDLQDESFRADELKVAMDGDSPAILYRTEALKKDSLGKTFLYTDDKLYSKKWNASLNKWEKLGSTPIFDRDTLNATVSGTDTTIKMIHGNVIGYLDGVVCDYNNRNADFVSGPNGKLYAAYIGNVKNFEKRTVILNEGDSIIGKAGPAYVVIKRLYDASESPLDKSIWAGPSQYSGHPRYEGDILSWNGTNLHAVKEVQSVKLAYGGNSLFLAVVYRTHPEGLELENQSENAYVDESEHALTVFKGTYESNVNADGVVYSKYLRWTALEDNSIVVAKDGNILDDERKRVIYVKPNDAFDMEVRGNVPYILFRNSDNNDKISVIKYADNKWSSIGNPAFAYPVQSIKSADLAVKSDGSPYVVFKQGLEKGFAKRNDRLVAMRYSATNAVDLTISALDLGTDSLNTACAFRQYILNYVINAGNLDTISIKPTLRAPSKVARMDIYVNGHFVQSRTKNSTAYSRVGLKEKVNMIELRVVGTDSSDLSYNFNVYRKPKLNTGLMFAGNADAAWGVDSGNVVIIDPTPLLPPRTPSGGGLPTKPDSTPDTAKFFVDVGADWNIHLIDTLENKDTTLRGGDSISFVNWPLPDIFLTNSDSDTVFVNIRIRPDTIPPRMFFSSSSVNLSSSSINLLSSSSDEDIYQIYFSSSSCDDCIYSSSSNLDDYSSSSSSGEYSSSSSSGYSCSSSTFLDSLSANVPVEVMNAVNSKFQISGDMRISDWVSVYGTLWAGNRAEIGVDAEVLDEIVSGGDVTLANRSKVKRVRLAGNLHAQQDALHGEVVVDNGVSVAPLPQISFTTGTSDIIVAREQTAVVSPGAYRNLIAHEKAKLQFAAGDYYFDSFWIDPHVEFEFAAGTRVWVANGFNVASFCRVTHEGGAGDLFVYIGASGYVSIGNNVQMQAVIYAPRASVQVFDHTILEGAVWAENLNVEPHSVLK